MSDTRVPFLILGGGAAAFSAATRANDLGVRTIMVNAGLPLGGTCVNVGCVPSKHLLMCARTVREARVPGAPGVRSSGVQVDYTAMKRARDAVVYGLRGSNYHDVLDALPNVELIEGHGRFVDAHAIDVNGRRIQAARMLVAVGSRARTLDVPGGDLPGVLDNRSALELETLPDALVVVGGGPQGVEWAQAFARLGVQVTLLQSRDQLLRPLDADVASVLAEALSEEGVDVRTSAKIRAIAQFEGGTLLVSWTDPTGDHELHASHVLAAAGVTGNADGIDAHHAGLDLSGRGFLSADDGMRTSVPHIFAAGDVIGRFNLEHAAAKEGQVAATNALTDDDAKVDYPSMPAVVFSEPEAAWVGSTERDYMEAHGVCKCRAVRLDRVPRALATDATRGIARITLNHQTERIVGAQMVGPHAGEAIHEMVVAIRAGLTLDELLDTVHAFPTYSEAFKIAALAFRRDVSVMTCCIG